MHTTTTESLELQRVLNVVSVYKLLITGSVSRALNGFGHFYACTTRNAVYKLLISTGFAAMFSRSIHESARWWAPPVGDWAATAKKEGTAIANVTVVQRSANATAVQWPLTHA